VLVPTAVVSEIEARRAHGYDLPDVAALTWAAVVTPAIAVFLPAL
jgi:hypothetical protein